MDKRLNRIAGMEKSVISTHRSELIAFVPQARSRLDVFLFIHDISSHANERLCMQVQ